MIVFCVISSILVGANIPLLAYFTGDMIDSFGEVGRDIEADARETLYYYLGIGAATFLFGSIMHGGWKIIGERMAIRCR